MLYLMYNLLQKKIQDFLTTLNTCSIQNDEILQFVHKANTLNNKISRILFSTFFNEQN